MAEASAVKRLIELSGLAEIERGMNLPNRHWAPENDDLEDRVKRYSIEHFGRLSEQTHLHLTDRFWSLYDYSDDYDDDDAEITEDRQYVCDQLKANEEWELHFAVLDQPFDTQRPLWAALGWDVTDGHGKPLTCLGVFGRQLIAFAKGLPVQGEGPAAQEIAAEDWGSSLEAEARKFSGSGRR